MQILTIKKPLVVEIYLQILYNSVPLAYALHRLVYLIIYIVEIVL
ncbi:hypothetical protein HPS12939_1505 [Glaesserella parasuis 12939]|nr:hypothetical protein HPSMNH_1216 [Glaesserella parasuis MN-H]EQA00280.1 hypothetical protein HPSNAG_1691 [Glaesserella parasuis str. Nagasaki]EQA05122.1 hypothetical protein HPS12939_1505 [Glaesserella parasuis 12939]EQA08161.1 hypothetical protein HPS8415995_1662 [Glaesserella parasuis 84-15995]EQA08357.1 hypothetical protein HPSD74_1638 [Glaesserella parasuis D74]